jgi:phosphoribosylanthranilate isomerase
MTWVKICGITNLEDAQVAVDAGADALGFVFYEKSPRRVDPETAREIVAKLPPKVEKVGVFVNDPLDEVRETAQKAGLTIVQISGDQVSSGLSEWIEKSDAKTLLPKLIFTVAAERLESGGILVSKDVSKTAYAVLVDSGSAAVPGGTGKKFDWNSASGMIASLSLVCPTIVAGGLTPANVAEAIRLFQPFGVDVASGVEARPGKKDPAKVTAFVHAAREAGKKQ